MRKTSLRPAAALLCLLASACLPSAAAQEIQISASVDKETVSLNDQ
ncbi:MAG: hypothetical protein HY611_08730, partial [Elusimicrobia bacterium]|nr:hypothetical protein [Elusimicrobiota bacterium]